MSPEKRVARPFWSTSWSLVPEITNTQSATEYAHDQAVVQPVEESKWKSPVQNNLPSSRGSAR